MKKYLFLLLVLCLVGCGKKDNNVRCVHNFNEGYEYQEEITIEMNGDKVASLKSELTFDDEVGALLHCESLKSLKDYELDKLDFSCGKKSITINNYELMTDIDKEIIGMTREEVISLFTEYQYACK